MAFKIKEIQEKKAILRLKQAEVKSEIISTIFNPQAILTGIATAFASKYLKPQANKITIEPTSYWYKNIISRDESGILGTAYSVIKHPVISGFLLRTRKSWIKWQLFSLGIFLIKKGYDYYKNQQYTKVTIIEETKVTGKPTKAKHSILPWK